MVGRGGPAENSWLNRYLPIIVAAFFGLLSTAIVFYFSSRQAEVEGLRSDIRALQTEVTRSAGDIGRLQAQMDFALRQQERERRE